MSKSTTDDQVARLLRQCRVQGLALLLLACLVGVGVLAAADPAGRANDKFELADAAGKVRYRVELDPAGNPIQTFLDADGTARIKTFVDTDGTARHRLFDQAGRLRVALFSYPDGHKTSPGWGGVVAIDPRDKASVGFRVSADGTPEHLLTDATGAGRILSTVDADGTAWHQLSDGKQYRIASAAFGMGHKDKQAAGWAGMLQQNPAGKRLFAVGTHRSGDGASVVYDHAGKPRLVVNSHADGVVNQRLLDQAGKIRYALHHAADGQVAQVFADPAEVMKVATAVDAAGAVTAVADKAAVEQMLRVAGLDASVLEALRLLSKQ